MVMGDKGLLDGFPIILPRSSLMSLSEFDMYVAAFRRSGFAHCLSYYHTYKHNYDDSVQYFNSKKSQYIYHPGMYVCVCVCVCVCVMYVLVYVFVIME